MRRLLRLFAALFAVSLLLGNTNCTKDSNSGAPDFVTTLAIQDTSSQGSSTFTQAQPIQLALTIRNRSNVRQALFFNGNEQVNFAVVQAGTANVLWNCDNAGTTNCSVTPAPGATSIGLPAGASTIVTATWDQTDNNGNQLVAGSYEVLGGFTVYNTTGLGDAAASGDSMAAGAPTAGQLFPTVYRSVLLPFTIVTAP